MYGQGCGSGAHISRGLTVLGVRKGGGGAPDRDILMAESGNPDIDFDEEGTKKTSQGPYAAEDWDVPDVVEHARPIEGQAI